MNFIPSPLFVFEMANNHMGQVDHGIKIIKTFGKVTKEFPEFKFAFKLQYRDLDTFIHPDLKNRIDLKYIKRFSETKLSKSDFDCLITEMRNQNFLTMATPFDEISVATIKSQSLDFLKIASCSLTDWPLLERAVTANLPIIASTAGSSINDIDKVVSFFQNRNVNFALLHCVGEYPTPNENFHLSQINFLQSRYPNVRMGFSTHEDPSEFDIVKIAIAKGSSIFEKHVGIPTDNSPLNEYSANPDQIYQWLTAARKSFLLCGTGDKRLPSNPNETSSLRSLRRGIFAKKNILAGEKITSQHVYFAFPPTDNQFTANDWSKYATFTAKETIGVNAAIDFSNTIASDTRQKIWEIIQKIKELLLVNHIIVPGSSDLEISHHYGIEKFYEFGLVLITVINRDYCKKLLVSLPNQKHPEQYHNKKEETFHVLAGEVELTLNGIEKIYYPGDVITIEPGVRHSFISSTGSVIEEISTTHHKSDSYYSDEAINQNNNRKTFLTYWMN
jgi:sialic acid synthase SpsE/mannose-6-phosphate isomerase-like protein (cupin superfamily)